MRKIGRPTKYQHKFIKEAEIYLQECKTARKVPFIEEFAGQIGVSEDSVKRWTEANEDFCGAIDRIKDHQRLTLMTLGLKSPAMLIFLLKANHGMIETEKIQHEGTKGEPLSIIFTDSKTFDRAEENRKKLEQTNRVRETQVQFQKSTAVVDGSDWPDYSGMAVDEKGQNLI